MANNTTTSSAASSAFGTDDKAVAAEKLREAAALVYDAACFLNDRASICPNCKRVHAEDNIQFRAHQEVSATARKLSKWADAIISGEKVNH